MENMLNIKINGKDYSVPAGTTILDACRMNGIYIPTLCYLKDINAIGACRVCVVEVKGARTLCASCVYPVAEGMEVMTNTDGTPSRIDSVDPNAKVGFLEPAQGADGAFTAQLSIMEKNIMRGSFAVETPEIKSGADMSSRTVKMLFADGDDLGIVNLVNAHSLLGIYKKLEIGIRKNLTRHVEIVFEKDLSSHK